jgi:hypothetical protein
LHAPVLVVRRMRAGFEGGAAEECKGIGATTPRLAVVAGRIS